MTDVKWIKIATDIFDDEKILLIESLPSSDALIVIWFKLLCLAGKNNNDGVFMMNDRIPYTDEMLATVFRKDVNIVRLALKTFSDFGMIEIIDGVVTIPNWSKHQQLEKIKARNEYMKLYMRERRTAQKALICDFQKVNEDVNEPVNVNVNDTVSTPVNVNNDVNVNITDVNCKQVCKQPVSALDRYKEDKEDKEDDRYKIPVAAFGNMDLSDIGILSIPEFLNSIVDEWNTLQDIGIKPIKPIDPESKTAFKIYWDVKTYGRESFTECIANIRKSDYLKGLAETSKNPITFDWLIQESNYIKVCEGTYDNFEPFPVVKGKKGRSTFNQMQERREDINELEAKLLDN